MKRSLLFSCLCLCTVGLALPVQAAPRVWSDDFTAVGTYNSVSWLAPCYGPAPFTKYTLLDVLGNLQVKAASGGGMLRTSALSLDAGWGYGRLDMAAIGALNLGPPCTVPAGVPYYGTSEPFTSPDVCIYGGTEFNNWTTWEGQQPDGHPCGDTVYGFDCQPGFANQDDDMDGTTDEDNEYPGLGEDGGPGQAGIDDDGMNGTDDQGETKFPESDDSDDEQGETDKAVVLRLNLQETTVIWANLTNDKYTTATNAFSFRDFVAARDPQEGAVEESDELPMDPYQPYVHYNYAVCVSGTCYGSMLWIEKDMGNPYETVGPVINTLHSGPGDNIFGVSSSNSFGDPSSIRTPYKNETFTGNSNFNDTFYVISGDARTHFPPINADFDGDHDVDGQDFMKFSSCFNGSLRPPKTGCAYPEANFDGDIDVDGQDFMAFSKCFNGSLRRPKCLPPVLTGCP